MDCVIRMTNLDDNVFCSKVVRDAGGRVLSVRPGAF
jgi:hypothetical protein